MRRVGILVWLLCLALVAPANATGPSTAPCPPGQSPTTISKRASLSEAAKLGAVKLTSKGGYNKDAVAVDATWKPSKGPVTVQIDVEFTSFPGGPSAAQVEASIEKNLPPRTAIDGTKVKFDVVARERAPGAPPSPCFHQTQLTPDSKYRGEAGDGGSDPLKAPQSGEWPTGRGDVGDRQIWTHEALHLAGLEDQYSNWFRIGSKDYPIPDSVDIDDPAAVKKWAESKGLDYSKGKAGTKPKPGHEKDIMGDVFGGKEKLFQADVNRFALIGRNRLTIESKPGDVLVNKDGGDQNLAVGAPFELTVEPGKPGHADGLVAYCIDLRRHPPSEGDGFDVLGPAGAQPEPAMKYLQRVLEVAAKLQPAALEPTPGAQDAIWRITDDTSLDDGAAIYAMAGVPDETFDAPHFDNPNAGFPDTDAVSPTGILPDPPPVPYLSAIRAKPAKLPAGKARVVTLTVKLKGARDKVRFELQRRKGGEWRRLKRLGSKQLKLGKATVKLTIPAQRPGAIRLVAIGDASSAIATLKIR
ncbi:MAG TPA: thioester domain-containing protein [Solirubrobacterales bacterium]|nr:thioester domain-containing protein [Solirubrobacterales bacterium]